MTTLGMKALLAACLLLPSIVGAQESERIEIVFDATELGDEHDPTGLWSPEEIAEGGSQVQPSVYYSEVALDGGTLSIAMMVDAWCGMTECPVRFKIEMDTGVSYLSDRDGDYRMACQSLEDFELDPIELVLWGCGAPLDLKTAF